MKLFILKDYHGGTKLHFNTLLTKVSNGLYGTANAGSFPLPTILKAAFLLLVSTYRDCNNEYEAGGIDEKSEYDISLTAMIAGLDTMNEYVEALPNLTIELINLSGFTPNKQSVSGSVVPNAPVLRNITRLNGGTTMIFDFDAVGGADFYDSYLVEGDGLPTGTSFVMGVFQMPREANVGFMHNGTKQRFKTYHNLIIGQTYTIFPCSGNSAGKSSLGDGTTFIASNK